MIIRDIMTKDIVCLSDSISIVEAKDIMAKYNYGTLPVVNKNKKLVGIISKTDIVKMLPSNATSLSKFEISTLLDKITCEQCMSKQVFTVSETDIVEDAAKIMIDNKVGCVPVVTDDVIVGVVAKRTLFELFTNMLGARYGGVRATFIHSDKAGVVAKISTEIAALDGNIVSIVTNDLSEKGKKQITLKVENITLDQLQDILKKSEAEILDIRKI